MRRRESLRQGRACFYLHVCVCVCMRSLHERVDVLVSQHKMQTHRGSDGSMYYYTPAAYRTESDLVDMVGAMAGPARGAVAVCVGEEGELRLALARLHTHTRAGQPLTLSQQQVCVCGWVCGRRWAYSVVRVHACM